MSNWPPQPTSYPVQPIPVTPYTYPPPVASTGRPGIITAIAVISIVVGSLGLLGNIESMFQAFAFSVVASRTPPVVTRKVVAPPPPTTEYIAPHGLSARDRQIVIAGLGQVRDLSDARRSRLDALLADAGQRIIHLSISSMTPDNVAANVTSSMSMPNAAGGKPDDVFVLGSGRLQVGDSTAVFFPVDSPSGIRSEGGSFTDSEGTHLAAVQIGAIVDRVKSLTSNAMNSTQVWKLQTELQLPTQKIINPSASVAGAVGQIQSAQMLQDSTVAITTDIDVISIGPAGEALPGIVQAAGYQASGTPNLHITRNTTNLMMLEAFLSFGAAAFLLTVGILTLKNSPQGRRLHFAFAGVKIILFGVAAYTTYVAYDAVNSGNNGADSMLEFGFSLAALGLIYPIALLIVLNTRTVREFYKTPTVGRVY